MDFQATIEYLKELPSVISSYISYNGEAAVIAMMLFAAVLLLDSFFTF